MLVLLSCSLIFFSFFEENAHRGCTFKHTMAHVQPPTHHSGTLKPGKLPEEGGVRGTPRHAAAPLRTAAAATPAAPSEAAVPTHVPAGWPATRQGGSPARVTPPAAGPRRSGGVPAPSPVARHSRTSARRRGASRRGTRLARRDSEMDSPFRRILVLKPSAVRTGRGLPSRTLPSHGG